MQEFDDDDFGDLYTDIEVQASSAINCIQALAPLPLDHKNSDSSEANEGVGGGDGGNGGDEEEEKEDKEEEAVALEEHDWNGLESAVESESESEDDLNIVLNDYEYDNHNKVNNGGKLRFQIGRNVGRFDNEDELGVSVEDTGNNGMENHDGSGGHGGGGRGRGESEGSNLGGYSAQYKRIRSQSAACTSNLNSNGSAGVAFHSSVFVKGNREDNGCTNRVGTNSIGTKSGHNFSLPHSRTILDVNIDALEWKPWRHPGADITDFFNFGLDEHSWKCYCNRLDRYRQQATKVKYNTAYEPWKHSSKQHEVGCEREVSLEAAMENITPSDQRMAVSPSNEISYREQQLEMPKGKAIQVKDSIAERWPSIDIRHPVERDSDVIIQIPVEDMVEEVLTSEKVTFTQETSQVHGASDCGVLGDDSASDGEMLCFSSDSEDGPSIFEGPIEKAGISNPERCFKHTSGCDCNPVSWGSDNCGSLQISDADKEHHEELADGNSETAEGVRSSDDTQKSVGSVKPITASSTKESESCHGEDSQHGPSLSPTHNRDLKARDGTYVEHVEPDKFHGCMVRASPKSVSEVVESITFDYCSSKDSRSHSIKMKAGDYKYLARRRSPIRGNLKFHERKSSRVSDSQSHIDYKDAFSLSDSDKFHDIYHPTFGHHDQRNRHHGFDFSGRHDFSYYQGAEYPLCCRGKYRDNLSNSAYAGNPHRSGLRVSEYERDQCYSQNVNGKHHFAEQRMSRSSHYEMEKDWDHFEEGDTVYGMESLDIEGPREFVSEQSQILDSRNHTRWKRKSVKLNFRGRMKTDYFIPEYSYSNKLTQEDCRSFNCNATEIDRLQHKHDGQLRCGRKKDKSLLRSKRRYDSSLNGCETIWCRDCEIEKSRYNKDQLSSWSYRELQTVGRGRGPGSPLSRIDIFESCSGQGRHNCLERYSSSCKFGGGAGVFDCDENMKNPDDQDNFAQRRLHRQSEILQWREKEYSSLYPDDNFQAEGTSYPFNRASRCKRSNAKNGSGYGGKLLDLSESEKSRYKLSREGNKDSQSIENSNVSGYGGKLLDLSESEKSRYKLSREGNKDSQFLENFNVTCWANVQRTLPRNRYSTEKHVVWDRKSSRCSRAASLMCYGRYEYLDWKDVPEQRTFKDLNASHIEKVVQAEKASSDIEEGEIATERFNKKPRERISPFKARTHITGTKNLSSENPRILEIIAKMEKRRERFKEPISLKIVSEKNGKPFADKVAETVETKKAQRPVRKRKWVGN